MIHVALDTSGIGKNRSQKHASYKALKRLIEANQLTVHAPYVVKRELESQELEYYLKEYRLLKESLKKFMKVPKSQAVQEIINEIQIKIHESDNTINLDAENFSKAWLKGLNSKIQEIDQDQAISALESYFRGTAPLTIAKNRDDIPDSFICRGFEEIKKHVDELIIIANDKKIIQTFEKLTEYQTYRSIDLFISDNNIQNKLKGLDILEKEIIDLTSFIDKFEKINSTLHNYLESNISDEIWFSSLNLDSNYSDDDATIVGAYEGHDILIDFSDPTHYGNNQIGYNFSLLVEAEVEFLIPHHEAYSHLDDDILMHMTTWNDYLSKVNKTLQLRVNGLISIQLNINQIDLSKIAHINDEDIKDYFSNIYEESSINIESIEEICIV